MSIHERIIILTLVKIFNWDDSHGSNRFEASFYSLKTTSLILSKPIKGLLGHGEVMLNCSLKVSYQSDEHEVIVKLSHFNQSKNAMVLIGEFILNLNQIATKKMQFFPFGKNDKVLKIIVGEKEKMEIPQYSMASRRNQQFIRQKEEFLRKVANTSTSSRPNDNSRLNDNSRVNDHSRSKKSFSQQAKDLLSEVRSMRQRKPGQQVDIEEEFNDYYQGEDRYVGRARKPERVMNKSSSERNYLRQEAGKRNGVTLNGQRWKNDQSDKKSNRSQKHRLVLKNLEMLACQNQYYDQAQEKGERRSDLIVTNSIATKKRLFKSQLA